MESAQGEGWSRSPTPCMSEEEIGLARRLRVGMAKGPYGREVSGEQQIGGQWKCRATEHPVIARPADRQEYGGSASDLQTRSLFPLKALIV